ncbi:DUF362 domain-containing protein [Thermodesulfobacteriota bacterium]
MMKNSPPLVGGIKMSNYSTQEQISSGVYKIMDKFENIIPDLDNAFVMLKINLCLLIGPETGATVDPKVVRGLVDWFFERRNIKEIIIAESDATHMSAEIAYRALGWESYFEDLDNVRFLNLSKDRLVEVRSEKMYIKDLRMSETYMNCDWLIDVAKLKTHTEQVITCCMKNIFGAIPEKVKHVYHPRLTDAICDANAARLPNFGFIDGLIAVENDGPTKGTPRLTGLLLAGNNVVALDHYSAKIMGFNPNRIPHLKMAITRGLGTFNYSVITPEIKKCNPPFSFMPRWKQVVRWGVGKLRSN